MYNNNNNIIYNTFYKQFLRKNKNCNQLKCRLCNSCKIGYMLDCAMDAIFNVYQHITKTTLEMEKNKTDVVFFRKSRKNPERLLLTLPEFTHTFIYSLIGTLHCLTGLREIKQLYPYNLFIYSRAKNNTQAIPELALSFIIFGTKEMFDTVHEHYLPIERIITHPDFSEWTADLSLVYTFADMTSNKPGTVIALAGERLPYHVGSNVTVLTWGVLQDEVDEVDNVSAFVIYAVVPKKCVNGSVEVEKSYLAVPKSPN